MDIPEEVAKIPKDKPIVYFAMGSSGKPKLVLVLEAIDKLLHTSRAKEEVVKFREQLRLWDGPANAAKFLFDTFGTP